MKKKTLLWLDDIRDPFEWDNAPDNIKEEHIKWLVFSPIVYPFTTVWVKSYEAFTDWIKSNGLPDAICFDHDLGSDISRAKVASGMSKSQARREKVGTKTGMDCAKWLVEYCLDKKEKLPLYNIQSSNPSGKANIDGLLQSFIKHQKL